MKGVSSRPITPTVGDVRNITQPTELAVTPIPIPNPCVALNPTQTYEPMSIDETEIFAAGSSATIITDPLPIPHNPMTFHEFQTALTVLTTGIKEQLYIEAWMIETVLMALPRFRQIGVRGRCTEALSTRKRIQYRGFKTRPITHKRSVFIAWTDETDMAKITATLRHNPKCIIGLPQALVRPLLDNNPSLQGLYTERRVNVNGQLIRIAWVAQGLQLKRRVMWSRHTVSIEGCVTTADTTDKGASTPVTIDRPEALKEEGIQPESTYIKRTIKIVNWNIVSLRSFWHNGWLEQFVEKEQPDILCLYETKASKRQMSAVKGWDDWLATQGYYWTQWTHSKAKLGYAGTCILSKIEPVARTVGIGVPEIDIEGRVLSMEFKEFALVSCYAPCTGMQQQAAEKRNIYDAQILKHLGQLAKPYLWVGDHNVAVRDIDIFDGVTNPKRASWPGFTPAERSRFTHICDTLKLTDAWIHHNPLAAPTDHYTFYLYDTHRRQQKGWRLDYVMASPGMITADTAITDTRVAQGSLGSDHQPMISLISNVTQRITPPIYVRQVLDDNPRPFPHPDDTDIDAVHKALQAMNVMTADAEMEMFCQAEDEHELNSDGDSFVLVAKDTDARCDPPSLTNEQEHVVCMLTPQINAIFDGYVRLDNVVSKEFMAMPYLPFHFGTEEAEALIDSGASTSLIRRSYFNALRRNRSILMARDDQATCINLRTASETISSSTERWFIAMIIGGVACYKGFYVVDKLPVNVLLGTDFIANSQSKQDAMAGTIKCILGSQIVTVNVRARSRNMWQKPAALYLVFDTELQRGDVAHVRTEFKKEDQVWFADEPTGEVRPVLGAQRIRNMLAGCTVAHGVATIQRNGTYIEVRNTSDRAVILQKGLCVAAFTSSDEDEWSCIAMDLEGQRDGKDELRECESPVIQSGMPRGLHRMGAGVTPATSSRRDVISNEMCVRTPEKLTNHVVHGCALVAANEVAMESGRPEHVMQIRAGKPRELNELSSLNTQNSGVNLLDQPTDEEINNAFTQAPLSKVKLNDNPLLDTPEKMRDMKRMLYMNRAVFALDNRMPGRVKHFEATIRVEGPMKMKGGLRPERRDDREIMEDEIQKLTKADCIYESAYSHAAPVLLLKKKDGSTRFCVDYRELNKVLVKDVYPLPRISDALDALGGAKYFSSVDMCAGYWQIPLEQQSQQHTQFMCSLGLFSWKVLPFGLANATSIFSRFMDRVLGKLKWQCALVYVDDILIFSQSYDQHVKDLDMVLTKLREAGVHLGAEKCSFLRESIPYLGMNISAEGILPDPNKVKAVSEWQYPQTLNEVRQFLGMTGYYRKFVQNYAHHAAPLLQLIREQPKGNKLPPGPTDEQLAAFEYLKAQLVSAPILSHPNFDVPFEVQTDASKRGLGAVLCQRIDGREHVIAYISRVLQPSEMAYDIHKKEMLAIVWAVKLWRPYLSGRSFTLVTDNQAIAWAKKQSKNALVARWNMELCEYSFTVKHRMGVSNANSDALSRRPLPSDAPYGEKHDVFMAKKTRRKKRGHAFAIDLYEDDQGMICVDGTAIKHSSIVNAGKGLFATKGWNARELVALYEGEIVTQQPYGTEDTQYTIETKTDAEWINAKNSMYSGKMVNDNRDTGKTINAVITYYIDKGVKKWGVRTVKPVKEGEEFLVSYGDEYWRWHALPSDQKDEKEHKNNDSDTESDEGPRELGLRRYSLDSQSTDDDDSHVDERGKDNLTPLTREHLVEEQKRDKRIKRIRHRRNNDPGHGDGSSQAVEAKTKYDKLQRVYREEDGLLYMSDNQNRHRLMVPDTCRYRILYNHHGAPLMAHPGRNKVTALITSKFYWPGMTADIKRWLGACLACQRRKTPRPLNAAPLQPILRRRPFQLIGMDFYGPLPETTDGNRYILTMIDIFTRWPIAVPVPDRKASTVARAIYEHLVCVHGCPKAIYTDRGAEFITPGMTILCETLGIAKVATTGYQPQANGHVERFHQWIGRMMTIMANDKKDDWDLYISACLFAYRISTNESTGYSPFELVYGRQPMLPLDLILDDDSKDNNNSEYEYVQEIKQRLKVGFDEVRQNQLRAAVANINRRNYKKERSLKIGDLVLVWGPAKRDKHYVPQKFTYRHSVPGTVVEKADDTHYIVERTDRTGEDRLRKVHINRLSLYIPWDEYIHKPDTLQALRDPIDVQASQSPPPENRPAKVNDLVIVTSGKSELAFRVARVMEIRGSQLIVQWYGNLQMRETGTYLPGWMENKTRRKCYYKTTPLRGDVEEYSNLVSEEIITNAEVVCAGFALTSRNTLPPDIYVLIEDSPLVQWERELD